MRQREKEERANHRNKLKAKKTQVCQQSEYYEEKVTASKNSVIINEVIRKYHDIFDLIKCT